MRYRLIYYPPLALTPEPYTFQTRDAFQTYAAAQGWQQIGLHYSQRTHAALQGQPIYADVAGPTWAGDAVQYEDKTTSNHKDIK